MLDEVDKLSASHQGDPFSALLEVLDPEQNNTFRDNYLAVPFDLSKVLFIGTANVLDAIPRAAARPHGNHRTHGLHRGGKAADRAALPAHAPAQGQRPQRRNRCKISEEALRRLIVDYTREAGVRSLERQIGALLRNAAVTIASGDAQSVSIGADDVARILGARALRKRRGAAHQRPRRGDRARLDSGGRRHSVHRIEPRARQRQAHLDRATRRRDERKRSSRGHLGEVAGGPAGHRIPRRWTTAICTFTCRRAPSRRTVRARAWPSPPRWPRC